MTLKQKTKSATKPRAKSPSRKTTGRTSGRGTRHANEVWHVFRFRERFELADDQRFCRKGPIIYARDYVTPADDESCAYLEQIATLRRERDGLELEGAWSRIRALASRRSRAYRGYLLNERFEPASTNELARTVLYVTPKRAEKILGTLEAIGLIERLPVPDWDLSLNDVPKKKTQSRSKKEAKSSKTKSRRTTRKLERARETTSATERRRAPLRAKNESRIEKESEREINPNRVGEDQVQVHEGQERSKGQSKAEQQSEARNHPNSPATAPRPDPADPTPSDAGQARVIPFAGACSCSDNASAPESQPASVPSGRASSTAYRSPSRPASGCHGRGDPVHVGEVVGAMAHRFDGEAQAFALGIFDTLGLSSVADGHEGRSELGAFASLWHKSCSGLSPPIREGIKAKAFQHARQVARNGKRCNNLAAVWTAKFKGLCRKFSTSAETATG